MTGAAGPILALDTATATAVIAIGDRDGRPRTTTAWVAGYRHGEELLARLDELLADAGIAPADLGAIAVGTGPGSFTGLRIGLATAKGLAHALGIPILGITTSEALMLAAGRAPRAAVALLQPAGPSDRTLTVEGRAELLTGDRMPNLPAGTQLVAVDLAGRATAAASAAGERAVAGLGAALLSIAAERLAAGTIDDLAGLVPEYVSLPRGVRAGKEGVTWSDGPH